MAVIAHPPAKPDLLAQRESVTLPLPKLVAGLVDVVGKKITAYICQAKDVRAVDRWIEGGEPYKGAELKLRTTYHLVKLLSDYESNRIVQSWMLGLNPQLGDVSPARLLREEDIATAGPAVLGAARAFLAGG
jgi:hypothetical protein